MVEDPRPEPTEPEKSNKLAAAGSIDRPTDRVFLASHAPNASTSGNNPGYADF